MTRYCLPSPGPSEYADPDPHQLSLVWLPLAHPVHNHTTPSTPLPASPHALPNPTPALLPATDPPQTRAQHPKPLGTLQKKREATYWVRSRRAGSLGGPWGGQRGRGDKKAEQVFFFYILHREGCLRAGVPPGPLSGDHACPGALSPSSGGPCTSCPQEGSNPPQGWEAGQAGDRKGACFSLRGRAQASPVRGRWHPGNLSVHGIAGG